MEYISIKDAAKNWNLSERRLQDLCAAGRIPFAKKFQRSWLIPFDAERPGDPRRRRHQSSSCLSQNSILMLSSVLPISPGKADEVLLSLPSENFSQIQFGSELAYARGDFSRAIESFSKIPKENPLRLGAVTISAAAAISMGNYSLFCAAQSEFAALHAEADSCTVRLVELAQAQLFSSMYAPKTCPKWIAEGDFSSLPESNRLLALYILIRYLHSIGEYQQMLRVAETTLALTSTASGYTLSYIYIKLLGAVALLYTGNSDRAERYIEEAMALALPDRLIVPFAEMIPLAFGLIERCAERRFPCFLEKILENQEVCWKNWLITHNFVLHEEITLCLSVHEFQIASLLQADFPCAQIASWMDLSLPEVEAEIKSICAKLQIKQKNELARYLF